MTTTNLNATAAQPSRPGHGNYDLRPVVTVPASPRPRAWRGAAAWTQLRALAEACGTAPLLAIDTYPGVDLADLREALSQHWAEADLVDVEEAALSGQELTELTARYVTDDRLFGRVAQLPLADFYHSDRLAEISLRLDSRTRPTIVLGWGAALAAPQADLLVLADLPRWEIQTRQRAGATNWRIDNSDEDQLRKYKRSYFVEWRTADLHKRALLPRCDLVLDTTTGCTDARLATASAVKAGLRHTITRPFRVVPYFDPGSWGGQWMREVCGLDQAPANFAWCFDCVPEENSLVLDIDGVELELPASNLTWSHPVELLGAGTHARFGPEFPIRFDLLDTMSGGNLSLQVHPLTGYIQETFGMNYTQDESYYLLDAAEDAVVYLGTRTGIDPAEMLAQLRAAERGELTFPADEFVTTYPARKHDHFSIPAGTLHCSGANSMVLEISATPFIFTFKLWDWGRLGLDGQPRPINVDHAEANIQWDRDQDWVAANLLDQVREVDSGDGWREEYTGLHHLEFIETRRHWITGTASHHTQGTVHVKNLVEGAEAVVESPTGAFDPFVVHYAETFIIPASVGSYTVRPHGPSEGSEIATITAWVRGTERDGQ